MLYRVTEQIDWKQMPNVRDASCYTRMRAIQMRAGLSTALADKVKLTSIYSTTNDTTDLVGRMLLIDGEEWEEIRSEICATIKRSSSVRLRQALSDLIDRLEKGKPTTITTPQYEES